MLTGHEAITAELESLTSFPLPEDETDFTASKLEKLLIEASEAHHKYETETGTPDKNWARWYAVYIIAKLASKRTSVFPDND